MSHHAPTIIMNLFRRFPVPGGAGCVAALLLGASPGLAAAQFFPTPPDNPGVAAYGVGELRATPGRAVLYVTFGGENVDAGLAVAAALGDRERAVDALVAAGVPPENITASGGAVRRSLDGMPRRPTGPGAPESSAVVMGLRVVVEPLDRLDAAILALAEAGVEGVPHVLLEPVDTEDAHREATRRAVADARLQAEAMAEAAGVRLGPLMSMTTMPDFGGFAAQNRFLNIPFGGRGVHFVPNDVTIRVMVYAMWEMAPGR